MNRREAIAALGAAVTATAVAKDDPPAKKPTQALMLAYPQFTLLDLVGPHSILSMVAGIQVKIVAKTKDPITTDTGVTLLPQQTLKDTTEEPLLIFVPGGTAGTLRAMEDKEITEFLKSRGSKATYVTSVCTGSLVLGAAGLLKGYQATTHWAAMDFLKPLGAIPTAKRVVEDRNRITGAGVTAGLDFGLRLAAKLKDDRYAQNVQLAIEYDPEPPYKCGSPASASADQVKYARTHFSFFLKQADTVVKRVAQ
ncbi:MAG: DJ-1/PfpI family protein [Planctomycetia bacterium]|nr:DJ-1/PfpI family protein [Planctomycetia bacterium]